MLPTVAGWWEASTSLAGGVEKRTREATLTTTPKGGSAWVCTTQNMIRQNGAMLADALGGYKKYMCIKLKKGQT